jgi:hypothetical protein
MKLNPRYGFTILPMLLLAASGCADYSQHNPGSSGNGGGAGADAGGADANHDAAPEPCSAPAQPGTSKLCLTLEPQAMALRSEPEFDGRGYLLVEVFDTPAPGAGTQPLKRLFFPPEAETNPQNAALSIGALPRVDIDGLPELVYVRSSFADNPAWSATAQPYLYGVFMGGRDLNNGIIPTPPIREVRLPSGTASELFQPMTALRRFSVEVRLGLAEGVTAPDDAQGPVLVGAFQERSASNTRIYGFARLDCASIASAPATATGFLFSLRGAHDFWFAGQIDDFNKGGISPPGSIVSIDDMLLTPDAQKQFVDADAYVVTVPPVVLNEILPGFAGSSPYACPPAAQNTHTVEGG